MEATPEKIGAELLEELGKYKTPALSLRFRSRTVYRAYPAERGTGRRREAPKVVPLLPESTRRVKRITIPGKKSGTLCLVISKSVSKA